MADYPSVLVADDHPLVRDSLVRMVITALPGAMCVEADSWPACIEQLAAPQLTMALVDLSMPGMDGLRGVQNVRSLRPDVSLVVVSGDGQATAVREALALGARGFIPKSEAPAVIRHALALVAVGGTYIPTAALQPSLANEPRAPGEASTGELGLLTPRQIDVLNCLAHGLPNKLIASRLNVSEGTAKIHIAAIMRVLRVRNRTEAVVRAKALGFDRQ